MKTVHIHEKDNVAVCLEENGSVPKGHKIALCRILQGESVVKYGEIIGKATCDIEQGEWVHTHNLRSHLDEDPVYHYRYSAQPLPPCSASFLGYRRPWGETGIRNEIYIIPTVGCVNQICLKLQEQARSLIDGSIDGIFALTHPFGCSQLGEDNENIRKLLCSIALNPNASFVLFVGLGCENNTLDGIKQTLAPYKRDTIAYFNCQDVEDEIAYGMDILRAAADKAKTLTREPRPLSELSIGLKCGGSDGLSGITANPLVGTVTDRVVAAGGRAVLTEVPEMFGAEQLLMDRCVSEAVFEKYRSMIVDFKQYYTDHGFPVYENPSPGNKAGGISTLEEKSLGCIKKAGNAPVTDILDYGERAKTDGLSLLNAPGNDLIAATALAAAGCQLVLFTTGRGTPFSTFVPTVKIATNDVLADKKAHWIDFNANPMDADALFALVLKIASGAVTCKSEHIREIAFYKTGVTL